MQLLDANRLQPEVIVFDGFVHLDAQETPGLGRRLHDTLGGRTAVIGVSKTGFKDSARAVQVFREEETAPLIVTCAGIDLGAAKARLRMMHGSKRMPTLMKLAARHRQGQRIGLTANGWPRSRPTTCTRCCASACNARSPGAAG